jgi:hypothetical protein
VRRSRRRRAVEVEVFLFGGGGFSSKGLNVEEGHTCILLLIRRTCILLLIRHTLNVEEGPKNTFSRPPLNPDKNKSAHVGVHNVLRTAGSGA